ncbi:MAG: hypothetical protein JXB47_07125 [Anaerolineae bacterium]|nr:hypothetical protein [Anaerolineae bacterium]
MATVRRLEKEFAGQARFVYIDVGDVDDAEQMLFARTTANIQVGLPIFGFFDAQDNRISRQFGCLGEWRLREDIRALLWSG